MKTPLFLLFLLAASRALAVNPAPIPYDQLLNGNAIIAPPFPVAALPLTTDLVVTIQRPNPAAVDLAPFTFMFGASQKNLQDLHPVYDVPNNLITLTLTVPVNALTASTTFKINKAGVTKFSMDIAIAPQQPAGPTGCNQSDFQVAAQQYFNQAVVANFKVNGIKDVDGTYIDKQGVIHLYIDHFGKYYGHDVPMKALETNKYIIHLITATCYTSNYGYSFSYTGSYNPTFNIYGNAAAQSNAIVIVPLDFGSIGPFTDKGTFDLSKKATTGDATATVIAHGEITIHKRYYVSVTTGLVYTSLKNPQNITKKPLANKGDTTLVADDPGARGLLTVMAIYYPKGRSFLDPPSGGLFDPSRIGIVVGTQLGQSANENFLLGLSHDFATGGALTYGVHFGRRNIVSGANNFNYGTDKFTGPSLSINKEWNLGFFVGVSIDTRVAIQLIKSLAGSATP